MNFKRRSSVLLAAALVAGLGFGIGGCAADFPEAQLTLTGWVRDAFMHNPVEGAEAAVLAGASWRTATTDADGEFAITGLPIQMSQSPFEITPPTGSTLLPAYSLTTTTPNQGADALSFGDRVLDMGGMVLLQGVPVTLSVVDRETGAAPDGTAKITPAYGLSSNRERSNAVAGETAGTYTVNLPWNGGTGQNVTVWGIDTDADGVTDYAVSTVTVQAQDILDAELGTGQTVVIPVTKMSAAPANPTLVANDFTASALGNVTAAADTEFTLYFDRAVTAVDTAVDEGNDFSITWTDDLIAQGDVVAPAIDLSKTWVPTTNFTVASALGGNVLRVTLATGSALKAHESYTLNYGVRAAGTGYNPAPAAPAIPVVGNVAFSVHGGATTDGTTIKLDNYNGCNDAAILTVGSTGPTAANCAATGGLGTNGVGGAAGQVQLVFPEAVTGWVNVEGFVDDSYTLVTADVNVTLTRAEQTFTCSNMQFLVKENNPEGSNDLNTQEGAYAGIGCRVNLHTLNGSAFSTGAGTPLTTLSDNITTPAANRNVKVTLDVVDSEGNRFSDTITLPVN